MKKIALLTTGHPPFDERIFYKIAASFIQKGYSVSIICSTISINTIKDKIAIIGFDGSKLNKRKKISKILEELINICPDTLICCEPLPILAAKYYRKTTAKKIIICYDITEWYPENVSLNFTGLKRVISYITLFIFNIYVSNQVDILILGEKLKRRRYEFIAPSRRMVQIEHYPVIKYFSYHPPVIKDNAFTIAFTGLLTIERGIINVIDVVNQLAKRNSTLDITLKIIGKYISNIEETVIINKLNELKNVKVDFIGWVIYKDLSEHLKDVNICIDLREKNFIFNNSLPIKIFDYMACGKPVFYSDIKAIKKEIDISEFGYLINPRDTTRAVDIIENYINHPELLQIHSWNARKAAEQKYNWEMIEDKLLNLVEE